MWLFVDKMSIHFEEDKIKAILFSTKSRKKVCWSTRDNYGDIKIKEFSKVAYLDCELDRTCPKKLRLWRLLRSLTGLGLGSFSAKTDTYHYI